MFFLGIDIGKNTHVASLMDDNGKTVFKAFSFPNSTIGATSLLDKLTPFSNEIEIGMEATGHYWLALYSFLVEHGFVIHVINPIQKDLLETLPALEKAAVVAVQLEKFTQGLDGLIKQLNLSNQQYSQGLNKTENEINQKIEEGRKNVEAKQAEVNARQADLDKANQQLADKTREFNTLQTAYNQQGEQLTQEKAKNSDYDAKLKKAQDEVSALKAKADAAVREANQ